MSDYRSKQHIELRSAVCGEYTPAGVLFRLARRPIPRPEGGGFVVVGAGDLGFQIGIPTGDSDLGFRLEEVIFENPR